MASEQKITVNFLVDKVKQRVVLAEADSDFVDILFSFLTLPLGTIIRLLNKQSHIGCMDKLYESVENLDVKIFQTESCKTMLLFPRSAAEERCEDLKVNICRAVLSPRTTYMCQKPDCCAKTTCFASSVPKARCPYCQETMDMIRAWHKSDVDADKLFVKSGYKFIISDDLHITPASVEHCLSLIQKLGIENACILEHKAMDLGTGEILTLLGRLLVSYFPLTDLFFKNVGVANNVSSGVDVRSMIHVKGEGDAEAESNEIDINLFVTKANQEVSFVEAGGEFVNLVLSFLMLPLGSLISLKNEQSVMGSVDNLYWSAENFGVENFKSEECKNILVSPKLGPFCGYNDSMLKLDESSPHEFSMRGCFSCYMKNNNTECAASKCAHGVERATLRELNPKSPVGGTETRGGYAKGKFLVTADLRVSPLSTASTTQIIKNLAISVCNLVPKRVVLGLGEIQVSEQTTVKHLSMEDSKTSNNEYC
ncbi:uncharacterized protein A4U43_C02F20870 [Asparagus officinalis]|uniref:DUF674 family protein n=1 Tax=Asparagus officinalis TaxID=4686 RepID=A0A5P1FJU4_ASPOF|nr:uncharacterized protein A4U43_C02F20870 [Asparagus officinalis]